MKVALSVLLSLIVSVVPTSMKGADPQPFSLTIRPRSDSVPSMHDVFLDISLTNTAGKIITFVCPPQVETYAVDITGPNGKEAVPTNIGRQILGNAVRGSREPQNPVLDLRGYLSVTLLPGQVFKDGILLTEIYDMTTPGNYSVRLKRRIPSDLGVGEVESNGVKITVTYNPAVEKYK
jgi:hypothetical protein